MKQKQASIIIALLLWITPVWAGEYDQYSCIEDVIITDQQIEIVKRKFSGRVYLTNPPRQVPDTIWKEIYVARDGKIVLDRIIKGKHVPAHTVYESLKFE